MAVCVTLSLRLKAAEIPVVADAVLMPPIPPASMRDAMAEPPLEKFPLVVAIS